MVTGGFTSAIPFARNLRAGAPRYSVKIRVLQVPGSQGLVMGCRCCYTCAPNHLSV